MSTQSTPTTRTTESVPGIRPRARPGAVVWGLVVIAVSVVLLAVAASPSLRADLVGSTLALDGGGITALVVAVLGGTALLIGLVSILSRR